MKTTDEKNNNNLWPFTWDKMSKEEQMELSSRKIDGNSGDSYKEYIDEMNQKYKGIYKGPNSLKKLNLKK